MSVRQAEMDVALAGAWSYRAPHARLLPPVEADQEIWAAGVTYLRSRNERQAESTAAHVYGKVYDADRPELFFKASGCRAVGSGERIRVRRDSEWNVPEPELTLVVNRFGEVVGYTAGNDVSSRSIEGENPLYLPQAKTYDGSCALGPGIVLCGVDEMTDLAIRCSIRRSGTDIFVGEARTSQMKRTLPALVEFLTRELSFPGGVFLMTGTGIVPPSDVSLKPGDKVTVEVGELTLVNEVDQNY
ncbi:MAG: fumarylacetoacetate hydrolase family protein [Fimbriimonadaceae bacterium]